MLLLIGAIVTTPVPLPAFIVPSKFEMTSVLSVIGAPLAMVDKPCEPLIADAVSVIPVLALLVALTRVSVPLFVILALPIVEVNIKASGPEALALLETSMSPFALATRFPVFVRNGIAVPFGATAAGTPMLPF